MELPYITSEPGIGGKIREKPEYFRVIEVPVYEPSGEGSHLFINFTKLGKSTPEAIRLIAEKLNIDQRTIGVAGLKDKHALTTQTISIELIKDKSPERIKEICELIGSTDLKINWTKLHVNKIKPGHLLGNKFVLLITDLDNIEESYQRSMKIAQSLEKKGVPNFYGEQRFGINGENKENAEKLLSGELKVRDRWLKKFLLSSYQSYLFNYYLAKRINLGFFDKLMVGDICKKHDTGGLFAMEDLKTEQARFDRQEISFTGPMYGKNLWYTSGESGDFERSILNELNLEEEKINRLGEGLRRPGRIILNDIKLEKLKKGIQLSFTLPKGSFATIILREFMKSDKQDLKNIDD